MLRLVRIFEGKIAMRKLVFIALMLAVLCLAALVAGEVVTTEIPSTLTRDISLQGKTAGGFPDNPPVEGISSTTGLPKADGKYFPVLVQIDNNLSAMPQWGLTQADIMYELPLSGNGWTRLTALFADTIPNEAGPVRSARLMHADLREEWDALLLHFGEQITPGSNFREAIRNYGVSAKGLEMDGIGNTYSKQFPRTKYHGAPHNVSAQVPALIAMVPNQDYQFPVRPFRFSKDAVYEGPNAYKITINHKGNESTMSTYFYDYVNNNYLRSTAKGPYVDYFEPEKQLAYSNVIVQRTRLDFNRRAQNPILPEVVGSGAADIFIGGKYIAGAWFRATPQSRTIFFDQNGNELVLQPGRTWIVITNEETTVTYDNDHDAGTKVYYSIMGAMPKYESLAPGMRSNEVREMKKRLGEQGFIKGKTFTNSYDEKTVGFVSAFEQSVGLPADGIADSLTLALLYGEKVPDGVDLQSKYAELEQLAQSVTVPAAVENTQVQEEEPAPAETDAVETEPADATEAPAAVTEPAQPTDAPSGSSEGDAAASEVELAEGERLAKVVTPNKGKLNLRKEPKTSGELITGLKNGSMLVVTEINGDWCKVRQDKLEGYVMMKFLEFMD